MMGSSQTSLFPFYSHSSAVISKCSLYRYLLRRIWDDSLPPLVAGLLNPSTADAATDDATITRIVERARRNGYGSIRVWNIYAYRATDPKDLRKASDPIGPENYHWITSALADAATSNGIAFVGWGGHKIPNEHLAALRSIIERVGVTLMCLGMTRNGHPVHPLYISYDMQFQPWSFDELAIDWAAECAEPCPKT
jgi:hypothetical protein